MFKIEMTFLVPEDKVKFKKFALVVNEKDPSDNFHSLGEGFSGTEVLEGKTYVRTDPLPDLPEVIDGTIYNTLTEEQQELFDLVDGEYLFEYMDRSSHDGNSDEEPIGTILARSCAT
jgi:hypothetical protein